jgi:formylglycine-generating enzyme required for sulfatase activity
MAKPPDAFLSYTRFDDRHGAISTFRQWLSDIVREVSGEPFEIFQDVDDIDVGERWSDKLDQILDHARFFIPIMTPNYFKSEACRKELQKFLDAEARVGRQDLIIPIYYIQSAVVEDRALREADHLATVLGARQHADWRHLRLYSFRNRKVRLAMDELAREIDQARQSRGSGAASPRSETSTSQTAGPAWAPGTVFRDIDAPWCPEMVVVPPGEFVMGSTEAERQWAVAHGAKREWVEREKPQHRVRIDHSLAVGRYPVTFEQYDRFCEQTRREPPGDEGWGRARRPVINVSWDDAKAYVEWLAAQTRQPYRLLSESEWEYACRAGTTTRFWWGDEITPENANYGGKLEKTSEVGGYPASPFGLHDMHGNVWEWVEDHWHDTYEGAPEDGAAWLQRSDSRRVVRGGSWDDGPWYLRAACRVRGDSDYRVLPSRVPGCQDPF